MCLERQTRKFIFNSVAMASHWKLWTRQWLRLNLTAVCKMNCSVKAFFVPWHSCVERCRHQTLMVRGTDPRSTEVIERENTDSFLPLSLAAHQSKFWETLRNHVLPLFLGHCFRPLFFFLTSASLDFNSTDNMKPMGWPHWKIRMEMTLSKWWSNQKKRQWISMRWCKAIYPAKKNKLHK